MSMEPQGHEIHHEDVFVVSDLHLSDPTDPRLENFVSDGELVAFVTEHIKARAEGRPATLVIAGDFIDFPRIRPNDWPATERSKGATEELSAAKVGRAIEGHRPVFDALGRFLHEGNQLILLAGNHDVDLFWPGVRAAIVLALSGDGAFEPHRLSFPEAWSICDRGIYIEHGHQRSYDNRCDHFPPFYDDARTHIERPWGTFFMEVVYNRVEHAAPWINKVHPTRRAFALAMRHLGWDKIPPSLLAEILGFFIAHGKRMALEHALGSSAPEGGRLADAEAVLGDLSGVPAEIVATAERVAQAESGSEGVEEDREPMPGGAVMGRTDEWGLEKAAGEQLARDDVHTVIFGHTHRAHAKSRAGGRKAWLNTGTWTGHVPLGDGEEPTFEELTSAARRPEHHRTYAYVGPGSRPGMIEEFKG